MMKRRAAAVKSGVLVLAFVGCGGAAKKAEEPGPAVAQEEAGGAGNEVVLPDAGPLVASADGGKDGRAGESASAPHVVRRRDGTIWSSFVYAAPDRKLPEVGSSGAMVNEYLESHRNDLGLAANAQLHQRAQAAVDDFRLGMMQTFVFVVAGKGAPCTDWHVDVDVSWKGGPYLSRVETYCPNDPELSAEEGAIARVFGGTPGKATPLHPDHPEWRSMVVYGRRMAAKGPSSKDLLREGENLLRSLGANPAFYERVPVEHNPSILHYRLRAGSKGPCAGHQVTVEATPYRYEVSLSCDGQPLGAYCGSGHTGDRTCMGGLTCHITESEMHYASGKCVPNNRAIP